MKPIPVLFAGAVVVLLNNTVGAADPVCALLDPEKEPRAALLEAKLLAEAGTTWVERAKVEQVLAEQKLQALFGAGGVGERVRLGKLLKADVLVLVRRAKESREPALELVISETAGGLRLLLRGVPLTADPDADVAALLAGARAGIKKHADKVTEVVAVPPFVSQDLSTEHDHLKAALARVAEQAAQSRPGTLVVELEEAQALAKELALAAPGTGVTRPLPLFLMGDYRHTGTGTDRSVTLTLRAERSGKPVGKGEQRSVKPDQAAGAVRSWAAAALATGAPLPLPDARADADQLAARAREFGRIGNWAESLALFEAALLVAPDQMPLHADALFALSRVLSLTWDPSGVGPRAERSVLLFRRGLEHVETLVTRGGGLEPHENRRNLLSEFRGTSSLHVADYQPPRTREFIRSLQKEQREVLFRLLPHLIKQDRGEDLRFVGAVASLLAAKEQYEFLEAVVLHTQDLPGAKERTFRYTQRWNFEFRFLDSPQLRDYLDRLDKAGNAEVKAAVADMRKKIPAVSPWSRTTPDPNQPKPMFWDDGSWDPPSRVALTPLTFTVVGRDKKGPPPVRPKGLLAAGPAVDVVWSETELFLMREPGKLEPLWSVEGRYIHVHSIVFDGRFVWVVSQVKTAPTILVIDPSTGKVRDVSAAEGLPHAGDRGQTLVLAPLAPRRVAIAGGFGRAWVGVMNLDEESGKAVVRVVHEAREAQEASTLSQGGRTTVGFTPVFLFVVRNPDGSGPVRLIVGRGAPGRAEGAMNHEVVARPLVVDPETGDAKVLDAHVWGGMLPPAFAVHNGNVSFLDMEPNTARLQLSRLTAPGRKLITAREVPMPHDDHARLLFHDGRIHIVRHELGSRTVRRGSEWWIADPDGRRIRMIGSDLPTVNTIAASSHYGIVAWTSHIEPRQEIRVNAVGFVNLPPSDPAREPPVGLTPEDPERISARLTPVALAPDADTGKPPVVVGLTAAGPGVDVAWGYNTLYLMTEKGKLRRVWTTDELNVAFTNVCYDGRYVWAAARRLNRSPLLLVLDPKTGKVTAVEGFPAPAEADLKSPPVRFLSLLLTTLEPGRACVVGWSGRTWVATAAFDGDTGKATVKVVHTAADKPTTEDAVQWHSTTVAFTPTYLVSVRGEPGTDGVSPWRVLIGRGEPLPGHGTYNSRVGLHPLLVDPDQGTATVPDFTVIQRQQVEFASFGGGLLFVEKNMTRTGTFQLRRVGFPGTDKETAGPRVAPGPVIVHDGRVRIVSGVWWIRDTDRKVERSQPGEQAWFKGFRPSSHYGLVTVAELRSGLVPLCQIEFADPPQ